MQIELQILYHILTLKNDNRESYYKLRNNYPHFTYSSYNYSLTGNKLTFGFVFKLNDEIEFKPTSSIILAKFPQFRENIHPLVENIIFQIGMIELISYWKATCSPLIIVKAGHLTEEQIHWWKNLYYNGLGEFFYLNSIDATQNNFVNIQSEGKPFIKDNTTTYTNEYIIPIGGGKDSVVTLELLRNAGQKVHPLIMNPRGATIDTVLASGLTMQDVIVINRTIDPALLKLNDEGYLNGHTPFSAMLAFYTLLASALTGYKNIALSNESSANESTIPGTDINHQYSKSIDFESNFRDYYTQYINSDFNYFSFLRPLNELQIVSIFSKLEKYHSVFKSCNVGSKTNSWCGSCPKCLFTHIMLAAYKGTDYANSILGNSMLNNPENTGYFDELCGFSAIKPFECVGTLNDVQTAMKMIISNSSDDSIPLLARRFKELESTLTEYKAPAINAEHFLDIEQLNILNKAIQ